MKAQLRLWSLFLVIYLFSSVNAGNIEWMNFNDAVVKANKENKHILVDFYTDWCGWCKKLDSEVYSKNEIINFLSDNFVAVKLNPEKEGEVTFQGKKYKYSEFAQAAGVTGYPATGFFAPNSDFLQVVPGYIPAEQFISLLKYFDDEKYKLLGFQDYFIYDKFNSLALKNPENAEINFVLGFFEHNVLKNNSKAIKYYKTAAEKGKIAGAYAGLSQIAEANKNTKNKNMWMKKAVAAGYKDENSVKDKLVEIIKKHMKE